MKLAEATMEPKREENEEPPVLAAIESPVERLRTVLAAHRGERHLIAIRGYPDPDSIGAAMAHAYINAAFEIESTILYFDDISHQENRALVKRLAIDMVRYNNDFDTSGYSRIAMVDAQVLGDAGPVDAIPRISIVDHHRLQGEAKAEFTDIREDVGSTCAIYSEYLEAGLAPLDKENPHTAKLASALSYGIRSDTDDYLLARELDYKAAAFLAPYADHDLLMSISMQRVAPRTMDITQRAYANKVISDTFLIAGVMYVRDDDRDSIGQAADYLLRREGIDTVLCYGIVNNQYIDGSLRTTSSVVEPDRFLKELLGYDPHGVPYGGGRADKGAFKIPLGVLSSCNDKDLLWQTVRKTIEDLFLKKIGTHG